MNFFLFCYEKLCFKVRKKKFFYYYGKIIDKCVMKIMMNINKYDCMICYFWNNIVVKLFKYWLCIFYISCFIIICIRSFCG